MLDDCLLCEDLDLETLVSFVSFPANTVKMVDHKVKQGIPSKGTAASSAITSASDDECDIAVCFLQIHVIGTKVCLPTKHKIPPEVDLLDFKQPANPASANKTKIQS